MRGVLLFFEFLAITILIIPLVFLFQLGRKLWRRESISHYLERVAIDGFDMMWGAIVFETSGVTVSAYSWKLDRENQWGGKVWRRFVDLTAKLSLDGPNHCERAYRYEVKTWSTRGEQYMIGVRR